MVCGEQCEDDGVWIICLECGCAWRRTLKGVMLVEEWIRRSDVA